MICALNENRYKLMKEFPRFIFKSMQSVIPNGQSVNELRFL